ncbi:MAG: hypothetical protein FJY98_02955 [Candidatus Liptonbacteria bacterium]|nr:hypothetical protein [Candidatus Liptonbacteria bacterium]
MKTLKLKRFLRPWAEEHNGLEDLAKEKRAELLTGQCREVKEVPFVERIKVKREPFLTFNQWLLVVGVIALFIMMWVLSALYPTPEFLK